MATVGYVAGAHKRNNSHPPSTIAPDLERRLAPDEARVAEKLPAGERCAAYDVMLAYVRDLGKYMPLSAPAERKLAQRIDRCGTRRNLAVAAYAISTHPALHVALAEFETHLGQALGRAPMQYPSTAVRMTGKKKITEPRCIQYLGPSNLPDSTAREPYQRLYRDLRRLRQQYAELQQAVAVNAAQPTTTSRAQLRVPNVNRTIETATLAVAKAAHRLRANQAYAGIVRFNLRGFWLAAGFSLNEEKGDGGRAQQSDAALLPNCRSPTFPPVYDSKRHAMLWGIGQMLIGTQLEQLLARCPQPVAARVRKEHTPYLKLCNELASRNTQLVMRLAKGFHRMPLLDCVQEGNLGLLKAVEKFDWRKGYKFSTYASWWIRQALTRGISSKQATIRLPLHCQRDLKHIEDAGQEIRQKYGYEPDVAEVAALLHMDESKVRRLLEARQHSVSLDALADGNGGKPLSWREVLEDSHSLSSEEVFDRGVRAKGIREALELLSPREAEVLKLRFGLDDGEELTLEAIGAKLVHTRECIRQIENKALRKLRHPKHRHMLRNALLTIGVVPKW